MGIIGFEWDVVLEVIVLVVGGVEGYFFLYMFCLIGVLGVIDEMFLLFFFLMMVGEGVVVGVGVGVCDFFDVWIFGVVDVWFFCFFYFDFDLYFFIYLFY